MKKSIVKLLAIAIVLGIFTSMGASAFALEVPSSAFRLPTVKVREEDKPAPEQPTEEPAEEPAEEPTEEPTEEPAEEPAEEPTEEPAEEPTEEPAEEPAEEPTEEPAEEPAEQPADAIGKATVSLEDASSKLNVRAEGNSDGELLDKIANGEAVYVLASEGGWTKIRTASGLEGWVASSFLSIESFPVEEPAEEPAEEELLEQPEDEGFAYEDIDVSQLKVEIATTQGDVVIMGETITLTSVLTGFDGLAYNLQWQCNDGSGWQDVEGATGNSYSFPADENNIYFQWRLEVTI